MLPKNLMSAGENIFLSAVGSKAQHFTQSILFIASVQYFHQNEIWENGDMNPGPLEQLSRALTTRLKVGLVAWSLILEIKLN